MLSKERFTTQILQKIDGLPTTTGVYLFLDKKEKIYIGKATNIKERVKNHFKQPTYKDDFFIKITTDIGFIETGSEIEALILESELIKKYQPKFNSVWRDDKNYFYVAFSLNKDGIPYIFITHQPKLQTTHYKLQAKYIGPFVDGNSLKKTLKYLRRVFPYYTPKNHPKNKCTWCHLGLCPGPILHQGFEGQANPDLAEYKKNIKKLTLLLMGKRPSVLNMLRKEMQKLSATKNFEKAAKIRDKIGALEQVMANTKVIGTSDVPILWDKTQKILQQIIGTNKQIIKMECYDISNIQGKQAVGSMIVFEQGQPNKDKYRKFKIKMKNEPNDIAMLKEMLTRRFLHPEWKYPEIILIDGGRAQLNVAINAKPKNSGVKVISISKGRQELFIEGKSAPIPLKKLPQTIYNLIVHMDDEAHRFAITYHKKLRKRALGLDRN